MTNSPRSFSWWSIVEKKTATACWLFLLRIDWIRSGRTLVIQYIFYCSRLKIVCKVDFFPLTQYCVSQFVDLADLANICLVFCLPLRLLMIKWRKLWNTCALVKSLCDRNCQHMWCTAPIPAHEHWRGHQPALNHKCLIISRGDEQNRVPPFINTALSKAHWQWQILGTIHVIIRVICRSHLCVNECIPACGKFSSILCRL